MDWNGEARTLDVPRENVVAEIGMTDYPALADPWAAIAAALEAPIGCPPLSEMLRPGSTVALLTGDRFTDQMLGPWGGLGLKLLDYLNRLGIRDEDVTLVYAPGSHPSPHWRERLGPALLDRVRALRHDCYDEESLAYLGVTSRGTPLWVNRAVVEADFRLAIGEISPNLQGGWCGGGKIILPGVAGWDSIEQNHYGVVHEVNTLGLADGNPMRRDMEEAARMAAARLQGGRPGGQPGAHRRRLCRRLRGRTPGRAGAQGAPDLDDARASQADIYVLYPGQGSERHLDVLLFYPHRRRRTGDQGERHHHPGPLRGGRLGSLPGRAGTGTGCPPSGQRRCSRPARRRWRGRWCGARPTCGPVPCLYTARRVLERRTCFLVCDGISPQEAREYGFQHCTPHFDDALNLALEQQGRDARITVNNVSNADSSWLGRPVAWRAMPWREG